RGTLFLRDRRIRRGSRAQPGMAPTCGRSPDAATMSWPKPCGAARCAARRYRACDATSRSRSAMPKEPAKTAADFIPDRPTLTNARDAATDCKGCDLWMRGTRTVFGEGSRKAELMLVGEQPGDAEDLSGHPFVGPAGKLLDRA